MMREETRINDYSIAETVGMVDDPLKGLLMDKGAAEAARHIHNVQRKMTCVQEAMMQLVESQRASAKAAGCDCMDLYLATNKVADSSRHEAAINAGTLLLDDMKAACVLEWRAKQTFARQFSLNPSSRLHPFDAEHETHPLIFNYLMQTSPSYYKVLAAYETARLSLNFSLKALRKIALDMQKLKSESEGFPRGLFDKKTSRLSEKLIADIDSTGELARILQGLYFDMQEAEVNN